MIIITPDVIYKEYPRKEGKKLGLKKLSKLAETEGMLCDVYLALMNYKAILKAENTPRRFIKQFSTFVNNYEDYLESEIITEDHFLEDFTAKYGALESDSDIDIKNHFKVKHGF